MPQKNMTVRLRCSLDNGKKKWSPGECVKLPEQQARELIGLRKPPARRGVQKSF